MACMTNSAGAMMSAQRGKLTPRRRAYHHAAIVPGQDAAVDTEPRIGRKDDLDRVVGVEMPLVDDVVQPAADQGRDGHDDDAVTDDVGVLAGDPREADHQEVRGGQADGVAEPVPADVQRAEGERDRIGGTSNIGGSVWPAAASAGVPPYTSRR